MVFLNVICVISMKKKQKYYSYSQLNTFNNCPQKYKIIYIDKIKSNNESIEAFVGKRVHETLEWLYSDLENNDFISFDNSKGIVLVITYSISPGPFTVHSKSISFG